MNAIGTLASPYLREEGVRSSEALRKVQEMEDLIRYRIPRVGLAAAVEGLRPDFWQLRLMAIDRVPGGLQADQLEEMLASFSEKADVYRDEFREAERHALEIYTTVAAEVMKNYLPTDGFTIPADFDMPYEALQTLAQLPQWTFDYLLQWINSSLDVDIALFIIAFHREKSLEKLNANELKTLLRLSGERYGGYAQALDLWNPDPTTLSQPLMNAHLLGAIFSSKVSHSKHYTIEELTKRFKNNAA